MRTMSITVGHHIDAPLELVRAQFGDVAHHETTRVHPDVSFRVESDDGVRCRYHQVTRAGPFRIRQTLELERCDEGPLVNHIVDGQFNGGTITFDLAPSGENSTEVSARLDVPLRGLQMLARPILRRKVKRALTRALEEDRQDVEGGRYALLVS